MLDLTEKYKYHKAGANFAFLFNEWKRGGVFILQGGTRSGKTYAVLQFLIWLCTEYTGLTISIVRETLPSLRASVLRDFKDIMTDLDYWRDYNFNKSEFEYRFNGNLIEFFSVDNEQRVRGRKRQILYCNELNEITRDKLRQLMLRTEGITIGDYNPSMDESYIYDEVLQRTDCRFMVTDYTDNPHLSNIIIREIELLKETDPEAWKIYGQGQRGEGRRGLIFPKWVKTNDFPDHLPFWYGVDFGFSHDPAAIVKIAFDKNQRTIYLKEVAYQTELLNRDLIRIIKQDIQASRIELYDGVYCDNRAIIYNDKRLDFDEWLENKSILSQFLGFDKKRAADLVEIEKQLTKIEKYRFDIYCDRAEPKSIAEFRVGGLNAYPCIKGDGSVAGQISFLYNFRVLYIGENIDKEKKSYKWMEKKGEIKTDPQDANNHAMDAIRYGVYTHLIKSGYGY